MKPIRVLVVALAALLALAASPGAASAAIPSLPTDLLSNLLSPSFSGTPATAQPIPAAVPPQNPYLSPDGTNSMHNDAYGTNAYQVSGPLGKKLKVSSASYGISECATIAFDSRGRIVGLCGGLQGFTLRLIDPTTLQTIATLTTSTRSLLSLLTSNPFSDLCGGTYFYLDSHDVAYVVTTDKKIIKVQVGANSLTKLGSYDVSSAVPDKDCLIATMPDWSGNIFFATQQGRVGVVAPATGSVKSVQFAGEGIFNSMSGDETGAVYVVTDHKLYSVAADANGAPYVRWGTAYDRGSEQKPGQLSQGSGTTPTLLDNGLIAITDNADPQMHVQFYQRTGPNAGQLVCQAAVFAPGASDTENSLAKAGPDSVVVENNYGYKGVQSTLLGKTSSPGVAKVSTAGGHCTVDWTNPIVAPTSVPKTSLANGLVYVYAKPKSNLLDDSWYFTAIDIRTGKTKWMQRTGNGIQWNNHYASIYLGPDGAAYIATLAGLIRFKDGA